MQNKQNHQRHSDILRQETNAIAKLQREVNWLELNVKRNEYQRKLTGVYIEEKLNVIIELEIVVKEMNPNLLVVVEGLRNAFIQSIGMSEKDYLERYAKDLQGRKEVNVPPIGSENPSDALHAIHDEIKSQEGATPDNLPHIEPDPGPAIEVSDEVSGEPLTPAMEDEPPEPMFDEPEPKEDELPGKPA